MVKPYGVDQEAFIKATRERIDADSTFFDKNDWRFVNPKEGRHVRLKEKKLRVGSFYIKGLACFVPHQIIPGHVPSCPHCEKPQFVDLSACRWIATPKILFRSNDHGYLDTKLYYCRNCARRFTGYNKRSLELDAEKWVGLFDIHLTKTFAVDAALYSDVISSKSETVESFARKYEERVTAKYISDYHYFLYACRSKMMKKEQIDRARHDKDQSTLDHLVQKQKELTDHQKISRTLGIELRANRFKLCSAERHLNDPIDFDTLIYIKDNRNGRDLPLKGIGTQKLRELVKLGVKNGQQLLDWCDVDGVFKREKLAGWKHKVKRIFEERLKTVRNLKVEVESLERQLAASDNQVMLEHSMDELLVADDNGTKETAEPMLPVFSSLKDPTGYNARFLSKARIEMICRTQFQHRRDVQDAKMRGLRADILRLDFNYKIAGKVRVYTGPGRSFKPFKCLFTMQNEDALTILWKGCRGAESIEELEHDLRRFKIRNEMNGGKAKVIYVDNCCITGPKLMEIFGEDVLIKLDVFHWLKRWNKMLAEPNSEHGILFRVMMSQAVFVLEPSELDATRDALRVKLKREPTNKEVMRNANSVIPSPSLLRKNVKAVLKLFSVMDLHTELEGPAEDGVPPKKYFIDCSKTRERLTKNQLHHIDKNCLSDPPPNEVPIHRKNPLTGKTYTARGTSTLESDNLWLDRITGNSIGVALAERLIGCFFEENNDRKRHRRLGEAIISHYTESLALLNTYAADSGCAKEDLPFPELSIPRIPANYPREFIGFQYCSPCREDVSEDVINPTDPTNRQPCIDDEDDEGLETSAEEPGTNSATIAGTMDETDFGTATTNPIVIDETELPNSRDGGTIDVAEIEKKASALMLQLPEIVKRERTFDAFMRLTSDKPWLPFHAGGTTPKTPIDLEEAAEFEARKERYDRQATPSSKKGYKSFQAEWNLEVARRFKAKMEGDDTVILIYRKTYEQLQQHYDRCQQLKSMAATTANPTAVALQAEMRSTLRNTRYCVPVTPAATLTTAVAYPATGVAPLGNPMTFNPEFVAPALAHQQASVVSPAPWAIRKKALTKQKNASLVGFNTKTWCITCGFQKRDHIRGKDGESFGSRCKRDYCARCGQLKKYHASAMMGPHCTHPAIAKSPHLLWKKA